MKLYIKIENGFPVNHPALEDNLLEVFGKIPEDWAPFVRVDNPTSTNHRIVLTHSQPIYKKIGDTWYDHWEYRERTQKELDELYKPIKDYFAANPYANNFSAWVFNEAVMRYEPPFPRPSDHGYQGKFYRWSGKDNNWKLAPLPPNNGKRYYFDFDNWVNVEITDNV